MAEETNEFAPLKGIKVVDWTQVQSGPSCTQILAWLGADVIKIEKPGTGDPTRNQLLDIKDAWGIYYLQLNANKKSLTLDVRTESGKQVLTDLIKEADIFVENIKPGGVDKLGFGWEDVHKMNPRLIMGSIKGFNKGSRFENVKAYEPVAQSAGGAASATGWNEGEYNVPTQSAAALGDSNSGMHLCIGILAALAQRERTGEGCYVYQSMVNATINLCRIKLRDQLMLDHLGALPHYAVYNTGFKWGKAIPRAENTEGGQVIGWCYKAKGWEEDPNDYVYIVIQDPKSSWEAMCNAINKPQLIDDPRFDTWQHRQENKEALYAEIEDYTKNYDKFELTEHFSKAGLPCGPIMDWYELEHDPDLNSDGTIVTIDEGGNRGDFKTIGLPFTMSNYKPDYKRAPDLGENNVEILKSLGYSEEDIKGMLADGTISKARGPKNEAPVVIK